MTFLEKMRALKVAHIEAQGAKIPLASLKKGVKKARHGFARALKKKGRVALIAEFKRGSPSRGKINESADLKEFIKLFDEYADCISVLTEPEFFAGSIDDLAKARRLTKKPILRKDFIIDEYQIYEARKAGADAALLISELVGAEGINRLMKVADSLGMDCLVECFSEEGLEEILKTRAKIIGINNRDLNTMEEDFLRTQTLAAKIPKARRQGILLVAESAIRSRRQLDFLQGTANAALVGTAIMSAPSTRTKLRELAGRTLVKICGTTNAKDAQDAVKLGADMIGLNFYQKSPRFVTVERAREIADAIRGRSVICGVFVNETTERVEIIAREVGLGMLQFSGDESSQYVNSFKIPAIKAVHMKDSGSLQDAQSFSSPFLMMDSFSEKEYGGTGIEFDKKLINLKYLGGKEIIFSGGLNALNIKGIIKKFRPFMVDVCSGVEGALGKKDFAKMKLFIESAQGER